MISLARQIALRREIEEEMLGLQQPDEHGLAAAGGARFFEVADARGYGRSEAPHNVAQRARRVALAQQRRCETCRAPLTTARTAQARLCPTCCREHKLAYLRAYYLRRRPPAPPRCCETCGGPVAEKRRDARYCSTKCKHTMRARRYRARKVSQQQRRAA